MVLFWLRVAAVLYAGASIAVFPAVLHNQERWKAICVHLGGPGGILPLCLGGGNAGAGAPLVAGGRARGRIAPRSRCGGAFSSLSGGFTGPCRLGVFALPITFFIVFIPALGMQKYVFPSYGVRMSWLVAHVLALHGGLCRAGIQHPGFRPLPDAGAAASRAS